MPVVCASILSVCVCVCVCVCKKWTNSSWLSLPLLKIISWENHPSRYREVEWTAEDSKSVKKKSILRFWLVSFFWHFLTDFSWGCNMQSRHCAMDVISNERIFRYFEIQIFHENFFTTPRTTTWWLHCCCHAFIPPPPFTPLDSTFVKKNLHDEQKATLSDGLGKIPV